MNIVVCDDQKEQLTWIKETLDEYLSLQEEIEHYDIETYTKTQDFINHLFGKMYDIAFLDIEIDENNGLELAKLIKDENPNCLIIFITSYQSYICSAFEIEAFQYMRKPIQKEFFLKELKRIIETYKKRNFKFIFQTKQGKIILKTKDILYIETYYRHLNIVTCDKVYTANIKQKNQLLQKLQSLNFIKVQRSYLVNMNNIYRITKNQIFLKNGQNIQISPLRRDQIITKYSHFLSQE